MNNLKDFLPEKYLTHLKNEEDQTIDQNLTPDLGDKKNLTSNLKLKSAKHSRKVTFAALTFLLLSLAGIAALMVLVNQNQDNRQQAFDGGPYSTLSPTVSISPSPTATPTLVITTRPNSESTCLGNGFWLNNTCYLNGEILPGGTHIVVSPEQSSYSYSTLMTIEKAEELGLLNSEPTNETEVETVTDSITNENEFLTADVSLSEALKGCVDPFYVENGKMCPRSKE